MFYDNGKFCSMRAGVFILGYALGVVATMGGLLVMNGWTTSGISFIAASIFLFGLAFIGEGKELS